MKKIIKILIFIVLVTLAVWIGYKFYITKTDDVSKKAIERIQQKNDKVITENKEENEIFEKKKLELEELKKINKDIVAILDIPDTHVYYPIFKSEDNSYYMRRNIYCNYDLNGSIFMDYECEVDTSTNLILYGHNMSSDNMFSDLIKYKEKEFFDSHRTIYLYTLNDVREYKVVGSYIIDLTNEDKFFNFNIYINKSDAMNSIDYIDNLNNMTVQSENVYINEDSKLITLSTCTYESKNARLLIVGVLQ